MQPIDLINKLLNGFNTARSSYLAKKAITRGEEITPDLRHLMGKPAGSKFLDLGCGVGSISILAARDEFVVYGLDLNKSQLLYQRDRKANFGINLVIGNGQRLPFRDRSFDVIYCCHVLEHIVDDYSALTEMRRVLKDDGILLLSVPNRLNLTTRFKRRLKWKSPVISREHLREYSKDELIVLLNSCGLRILGLKMTGFLLPLGNIIFNFATLQFGLQKIKSYLARRFPESTESIDIVAKRDWYGEVRCSHQWQLVFPLPWWLK